jgi:hypothetical protein
MKQMRVNDVLAKIKLVGNIVLCLVANLDAV